MREIKFKAYIYDLTDEGSHPLEIDIRAGKIWDVASINFKDRIVEIMDDDGGVWEYELNDEIALMQYTGRNDVNGVEIYDGYIVKFYSGEGRRPIKGIVEFDNNSCFYACEVGNYLYPFMTTFEFKVIGNIYENPELLKDTK